MSATAPRSRFLSDRSAAAAQAVLAGRRRGLRALLPFVGPGVIASIAYVDPGNFATNIQAGARYGYELLWVVLLANLIAMMFQGLSARLGIVTGRNLAELSRDHFPRPVALAMWIVSEVAAMATDLAEFLGAAIGLSLLANLPLLAGMVITALVTGAILALDRHGFRPLEIAIGGMVGVIAVCYLLELVLVPQDWPAALHGTLVPHLADGPALTIAVGIVGATVMPHAIYLHSGLTQARTPAATAAERRTVLRFSTIEVVGALLLAGLVNMAMLMTASGAFHTGHQDVAEIGDAYRTLGPLLGGAAAAVFLVSLIASGISSSAVGTLAGQIVMQGFVRFRIPVWLRRVITVLPAFAVVLMGTDPTRALVLSQVVLSLALPVPMVALLLFVRRRDIMGDFACTRLTFGVASTGAAVVLALNLVLILQAAGIDIPGLPNP